MVVARANRLLPIFAGGVFLMLAFVTLKSCSDDPEDTLVMDTIPQAPSPDADTPADTIKTLTANVAAMTHQLRDLRKDNTELRQDNEKLTALRQQIEQAITTRIERGMSERDREQATKEASVMSALSARMDALALSVSQAAPTAGGGDIPVGLGLDGVADQEQLVWIEPLDGSATHSRSANGLVRRVQEVTGQADRVVDDLASGAGLTTLRPVYTVPRNATLMGSTAMTALVGRIPVKGQVRDPMPFKVITGAANLAANGLTVPGVQGMIWSGTAIGDWTLSCVTGRLESVTFIFDDGTIRTLSTDDRDQQQSGADRALGWISDAHGIPCISGDRKSNAVAFLSQRIGITAVQAAAEAAAAAQTTSVIRDSGAVTGSLTGDTGAFVLGKTIAGGSDEVAKWLSERQSQSFDAVFVPAGAELAIHVDRELAIDLDLTGRRLSHEVASNSAHRSDLD